MVKSEEKENWAMKKQFSIMVLVSIMFFLAAVSYADEELQRWREAATQGDAEAQYLVGSKYYYGKGTPQNYKKAAKWVRKAAEQGFASAQFLLGIMYADGQGVPQNYIRAYAWTNLAAAQNANNAEFRDAILKGMTPKQIALAQELSVDLQNKIEKNVNPQENISMTEQLNEYCKDYKKYSLDAGKKLSELHTKRKLYDESNNQIGLEYTDKLIKITVSTKDAIDWLYDVVYIYNKLKKCDGSKIRKYVLGLVEEFLFVMTHQNPIDSIELQFLVENKQDTLIWKYEDYIKRHKNIVDVIKRNKEILERIRTEH